MKDKVKASLSDELLKPKYRGSNKPYAGHCYVASEAYYHLSGGRESGYIPKRLKVDGVQHWWLEHKVTGEIVDLTAEQFDHPVDYVSGVGSGFLTKNPSRRAQIVIDRVKENCNGRL